ncbi:hypothetical protein [Streptomyces sp. CB01881]|uniref:hypothetical protein n=1 Tax=Streptomyces sp. CB01881 TaxID=2078691 RepID=UPI000CDCA342|nr:hypothetical protein [Streptomyces sp. CB01881]AUY52186.1 hypothetical protein C2142_28330 [Streptomyces sp. CB01881]TYC71613.1 hypothetical protein EH183_28325 [Streptomyces sp. CB01881]
MPGLQRAVLLRAAAAVLVLGAAVGADHTVVGEALAKRGAERAERHAYVCAQAARADAVARAARSHLQGRPGLGDPGRPPGCGTNGR